MFYAQQLRWNDVDGKESTARNYSLNFTASSCKTNITSVNGNYSTAMYVKIKKLFLKKIK
jgi:hypothetical protein